MVCRGEVSWGEGVRTSILIASESVPGRVAGDVSRGESGGGSLYCVGGCISQSTVMLTICCGTVCIQLISEDIAKRRADSQANAKLVLVLKRTKDHAKLGRKASADGKKEKEEGDAGKGTE